MNAFEFVKEKGIGEAKAFLDLPEYTIDQLVMLQAGLCCVDLERIVESHELADRLGDVDTMRIMIEQMEINDLCCGMNISFDGKWQGVFTRDRLQQAIRDVEACQ